MAQNAPCHSWLKKDQILSSKSNNVRRDKIVYTVINPITHRVESHLLLIGGGHYGPPYFSGQIFTFFIFFLVMKNLGNFGPWEKRITQKFCKLPKIWHCKDGYSNSISDQFNTFKGKKGSFWWQKGCKTHTLNRTATKFSGKVLNPIKLKVNEFGHNLIHIFCFYCQIAEGGPLCPPPYEL